jgi:hypothetical protein
MSFLDLLSTPLTLKDDLRLTSGLVLVSAAEIDSKLANKIPEIRLTVKILYQEPLFIHVNYDLINEISLPRFCWCIHSSF